MTSGFTDAPVSASEAAKLASYLYVSEERQLTECRFASAVLTIGQLRQVTLIEVKFEFDIERTVIRF